MTTDQETEQKPQFDVRKALVENFAPLWGAEARKVSNLMALMDASPEDRSLVLQDRVDLFRALLVRNHLPESQIEEFTAECRAFLEVETERVFNTISALRGSA